MPIALTVLINYTVNYLILLAGARLCRHTPSLVRTLLAAGVGAVHVLLCLLTGWAFLGSPVLRILSIPIMGIAAFGRHNLPLLGTLLVIWVALDAVTGDTGTGGVLAGVSAAVLLWLLNRRQKGGTVPVVLSFGGKELSLTALRDTGNALKDPVTGSNVMVIGAEAAQQLTGLTPQQLRTPLETLCKIPGLRLIPYKAVGSSGFLLGMKLPKVQIGNWKGSHVVAFAPEGLGNNADVEALVGGYV